MLITIETKNCWIQQWICSKHSAYINMPQLNERQQKQHTEGGNVNEETLRPT